MNRDEKIQRIDALQDAGTVTLLQRIARGEQATVIDANDRQAAMDIATQQPAAEPGDGAAARAALKLLADDDDTARRPD